MRECVSRDHFFVEMVLFLVPTLRFLFIDFAKPDIFHETQS